MEEVITVRPDAVMGQDDKVPAGVSIGGDRDIAFSGFNLEKMRPTPEIISQESNSNGPEVKEAPRGRLDAHALSPEGSEVLQNQASANNTVKAATKPSRIKEAVQMMIDQWFLIALGLLIAIASQVQVPLPNQQLKRTVTSYLCISIIFFVYVIE